MLLLVDDYRRKIIINMLKRIIFSMMMIVYVYTLKNY